MSAMRFLRAVLPVLLKNKDLVVFSHMTEVQSFLIAPVCWILRRRHYLWYAHTSKSVFLYLSYPFLTGILTSTKGSCPIKGVKVSAIGQGIEVHKFASDSYPTFPPLRWYYIGRVDPSKNLEQAIEAIMNVRLKGWQLSLNIYGRASSDRAQVYEMSLRHHYATQISEGWLNFKGPTLRKDIREVALKHDGFINAFFGSLDKTLIEAAMSRRLIATTNPEFSISFPKVGNFTDATSESLEGQLEYFLQLDATSARKLLDSNFDIAMRFHSFQSWIEKVAKVLNCA